jgi:hypothetical protein
MAQGPLTPPGAPAATMKTLDQIEPRTPISALPFTISAPGSYYLTASLTAAANVNGITINASNVTLDLRGFEVIGTPGTAIFGIRVSVGRSNLVIRDGTVRNWPGSGVVVENASVSGVRVEKVRANANGSAGIVLGIDRASLSSFSSFSFLGACLELGVCRLSAPAMPYDPDFSYPLDSGELGADARAIPEHRGPDPEHSERAGGATG